MLELASKDDGVLTKVEINKREGVDEEVLARGGRDEVLQERDSFRQGIESLLADGKAFFEQLKKLPQRHLNLSHILIHIKWRAIRKIDSIFEKSENYRKFRYETADGYRVIIYLHVESNCVSVLAHKDSNDFEQLKKILEEFYRS